SKDAGAVISGLSPKGARCATLLTMLICLLSGARDTRPDIFLPGTRRVRLWMKIAVAHAVAASDRCRPITGSDRIQRFSSSASIRVARPSFRADNSPFLIAKKIRERERPDAAAAAFGVSAILFCSINLQLLFLRPARYCGTTRSSIS